MNDGIFWWHILREALYILDFANSIFRNFCHFQKARCGFKSFIVKSHEATDGFFCPLFFMALIGFWCFYQKLVQVGSKNPVNQPFFRAHKKLLGTFSFFPWSWISFWCVTALEVQWCFGFKNSNAYTGIGFLLSEQQNDLMSFLACTWLRRCV